MQKSQMAPVGAVVFSSYWQEHYTVVRHNRLSLSRSGYSITVQWHGDGRWANPSAPRETTHMTPLESRDRVVRYLWPEDMEAHLKAIREGSERRTA